MPYITFTFSDARCGFLVLSDAMNCFSTRIYLWFTTGSTEESQRESCWNMTLDMYQHVGTCWTLLMVRITICLHCVFWWLEKSNSENNNRTCVILLLFKKNLRRVSRILPIRCVLLTIHEILDKEIMANVSLHIFFFLTLISLWKRIRCHV